MKKNLFYNVYKILFNRMLTFIPNLFKKIFQTINILILNIYNFFFKSSDNNVGNYLKEIVEAIEKTSLSNKNLNKESSIKYLQRQDVIEQLETIINNLKIVELDSELKAGLGLIFLEMIATSQDNSKYKLNFWPCSCCSCIGVEKIC